MEAIRSIAVSVCITMAVTGILSILIPSKSMEKTIKLAVGLFFLSSIVLPFTNGQLSFDFDLEIPDEQVIHEDLEVSIQQNMQALTEQRLEQAATELLGQEKIIPEKVEVNINIAEDNSITITKVKMMLSPQDRKREAGITPLIKEKFGIEPEFE